jgi:hypothetical protein
MGEKACEKCGEECYRDEVDVGVGVIYGPWGCPCCGWSEDSRYDRSDGPSEAQEEHPDHYVDSQGGMIPLVRLAEKLDRFGLPGNAIVDKHFKADRRKGDDRWPR